VIAPGEKLSRYHLLEPLGSGGMSCVYRAYDPVLDREVAIKILPAELARDPVLRERFHEEARALGGVEHPSLIRIFAVGQEGPVSYYSMELITGMSLKEVLAASGRLTVAEAFAVIGQVLRALEAVHRAGIVHRDVKPGNIMLDASGRVVLMDFGLARRAERQDLTAAGAVLGTPEYMSPEQARGEKADERSDLYSIGVMLY
jgi:serine/threonine-protein kinase